MRQNPIRHITLVAAAFAALTGPRVRAQELPASGPLAVEEVLAYARAHNPELEAARERAAAAASVPSRTAAYDDPTFSWEAWNAPESFRVDRADNNILRLSQRLPFPGKRRLAGDMAERDADVARHELAASGLDLDVAVRRAYWDLWEGHQKLHVHSRDKELVQRFARIAETRYAVGTASQPDVLRAQVELTRLINRVTSASLALDGTRAELNALLSRAPQAPLGTPLDPRPPELDTDLDRLIGLALERRPELVADAAAVAREETAVRLARLSYLPDFELAAARFINAAGRDGVGAMGSITIPIAYKYKYDAAVSEANARLAAARAEERRLQDRVRRDVQQALVRARTALAQRELFATTHIPQAEQALRSTESAYETGRMDLLSLIDSLRSIEDVHLEHFAAEAEFERARADLERAVGGELPVATP